MGVIGPVLDLLRSGLVSLIYHLVVLLAMEAVAGIALIEHRHSHNPDQHRIFRVFLFLVLLRIPILVGSTLEIASLAPALHALEAESLFLMGWAFFAPLLRRNIARAILVVGLATMTACGILFLSLWNRALGSTPSLDYAAYWQQPLLDLWGSLACLGTAGLLMAHRRRLGYWLPAVVFALLAGGTGLMLFDQVGPGRMIHLVAYPLLTVAAYQAALQDLWTYRRELETLSEESLRQTRELLFLVEIIRAIGASLDLDTVLRKVAEGAAHALDADQAAILLCEEGGNELRLAAQYAPLQAAAAPTDGSRIRLENHPLLAHVVRRRRQVLLNPEQSRLPPRSFFVLLDSAEPGPVIVQPLLRQQEVLGVLVVSNSRGRRRFEEKDSRLCESIASQVSAAIDNARLYQRLGQQAHHLAQALQDQEKEVSLRQAILESTTEGILVTDSKGCAVLMNAAAEQILGAARDRILGRPLHQILEPATARAESLADSRTPLQSLLQLEGKQIFMSAAPVRSPSGERLGVVAVLRDVTGEVQAERAKREFIANVSHELRTPLTAILGYAEALYSGMTGSLTRTQANFVHIIHDNARRLVAIANNLIALSEAERGRLELEYALTDIPLIIGEVVQAFVPQMKARQLEWYLDIQEDLPLIEADPVRIRQVVANLVSNAVKFTFPGGRITVGASTLQAGGEDQPQFCRLWVQDTGIGIPPSEQSRVWERFYRPADPLRAEAGGLGVGLSIVKSLVTAHGGRVWLDSAPGEGSTFTILLPVRRPPSPLPSEGGYPDLETAIRFE